MAVPGADCSAGGRRYVKFDTFHPAVDKGLPVTRVVSRVTLQAILAEACKRVAGEGVIQNNVHIVDYEEKVRAQGRVHAETCPGELCMLNTKCLFGLPSLPVICLAGEVGDARKQQGV